MDQPTPTIRRLLIVADDQHALQAMDEAAMAFGLLVRRVRHSAALDTVVEEFGPDAVILDPAAIAGTPESAFTAVSASGAVLLLLGSADDGALRTARELAAQQGLRVAGIMAKPIIPESLEMALRAIVGDMVFSAAEIAGAVMRGEIAAWYQLQLLRNSSGWHAGGAEALARWEHPEHGVVMPGAFVPVAEAEGQIAAITDCVLQTAVQQLSLWHRQGMPFRVGVNLSPSLVTDPDFPDRLSRLVHEFDVPPRALLLEIPEPGLMEAPPGFLGLLARLRVHGFGLALEHFGSGVSSLADLYRTPFSELKIDRRLTSLLDEDEDARQLVRGIIVLAKELGLSTTAEAVETEQSLAFLHAAGCDCVQGYIISRPLPTTSFQSVAKQWL
jgi:EAL domain-containing protein (putative c-di-GMP-specific phosphodiesterase class I)